MWALKVYQWDAQKLQMETRIQIELSTFHYYILRAHVVE